MRGYFEIQPLKINLAYKKYRIESYYNDGQGISDIEAYRVMTCNGYTTFEHVDNIEVKRELIKAMGGKLN